MVYPQLSINLELIKSNAISVIKECDKRNMDLVAVEKLVAGDVKVAQTLIDAGIKTIADSRVFNLKKLQNINAKKMLLRIPMMSEIKELVKFVDVCLVSEIEVIKEIDKQTKSVIEVILMIETGDIREGLWGNKVIFDTVQQILKLKNIKLTGIGTNFACFGATVPTITKMQEMSVLKKKIEERFGINIPIISAGNSSHISIWDDKKMPKDINQIRCGSAILMGFGLNNEPIPFVKMGTFKLNAEIIELQYKPSASWGKKGLDAFGKEKEFKDIGVRKKVIIALGRQDCPFEELTPLNKDIKILGQSSDHTILDITDCRENYKIGDIISFDLEYLGVLCSITSEFVHKKYIEK
ncbi:alanine/ornithine racemase family PLP-dependent enzyme [Spiroplasma endosymbiont of Anurida maritima]|uniref:alanine/ornithine racemase family PLP-dependent enzyme n=1 Tax=Spiroplasma endosymbiont of Anurida maritima TaxID=2967972 RepID=UPI0036D3C838